MTKPQDTTTPAGEAPASSSADERLERLADQVERLGEQLVGAVHAVGLGLEGIGALAEQIGELAAGLQQNNERARKAQQAALERHRRIARELAQVGLGARSNEEP